jgi:hypothetical protein
MHHPTSNHQVHYYPLYPSIALFCALFVSNLFRQPPFPPLFLPKLLHSPSPPSPPNIQGFSSQNLSLIMSTCSTTTFAFCFLFLSFSNCVFDFGWVLLLDFVVVVDDDVVVEGCCCSLLLVVVVFVDLSSNCSIIRWGFQGFTVRVERQNRERE